MARAGRSSGGSRSSGSRSSSRSSGSFRSSGGSSRAGRSYSSSSRRSYGGSHHTHYHYGGGYHGGYRGSRRWTVADTIVLIFILVCFLYVIFGSPNSGSSNVKSTIERTRIDSGLAYSNDVVLLDELGWVESKSKVGNELRYFWDETGVQPYIMFLKYDEDYNSDAEREAYTEVLYSEYIEREDAFLFVYYGERNEEDVGLFCYTLGKQAAAVLDGEALEIWFNKLDYHWYGSGTTTDVLIKAYSQTADTIMGKPTNGWDFGIVIALVAAGIAGMFFIVKLVKAKYKREKEKAQETQDILNASMSNLSQGPVDDGLLDKYK